VCHIPANITYFKKQHLHGKEVVQIASSSDGMLEFAQIPQFDSVVTTPCAYGRVVVRKGNRRRVRAGCVGASDKVGCVYLHGARKPITFTILQSDRGRSSSLVSGPHPAQNTPPKIPMAKVAGPLHMGEKVKFICRP